jgi:hypothetical protein
MATTNLIFGGNWVGVLRPGQPLVVSSTILAPTGDASLSVMAQANRTAPTAVYSVLVRDVSVVTQAAGLNLNFVVVNTHSTQVIESIRFTYCVTR